VAADTSSERSARNEDAFRKANERIERAAAAIDADDAFPFLCECPDPECVQTIRLTLDQYARVREHPRQFVVATGHEPTVDGTEVVERGNGYDVVMKTGAEGAAVETRASEGANGNG
jgi:hypothetical protein